MPKPRAKERKNDFIRRCVHDLVHAEGKTPDQALGQCYGVWNEHQKKHMEDYLVAVRFFNFLKGKETKPLAECSKCGEVFVYLDQPEAGMGYVKCPLCNEPVSQPS